MRRHAKSQGGQALNYSLALSGVPDNDEYQAGVFEREPTYTPEEQKWVDHRAETVKQASRKINKNFPDLAAVDWKESIQWSYPGTN